MINRLTAPFILFVLALSLSGCIIDPYHHHDHYDNGGYGGGGYGGDYHQHP